MKMRAISLFTNCGAGDIGYASSGFRFEVMAEIDRRRLDVALLNHPSATGVYGDLRTTWKQVVQLGRRDEGRGRLALLSACPPCQGMSSARGRRGRDNDADSGTKDQRNLLVIPIAAVAKALAATAHCCGERARVLHEESSEPPHGQADFRSSPSRNSAE